MPKAVWNGVVIAESDDTVVVEGNHYFPRGTLRDDVLVASATRTTCPWKGVASYYTLKDGDRLSEDAVWFYADPKEAAGAIRGRVAFWKDVQVLP